MSREFLFDNSYKYCTFCGRTLPADYEEDCCPGCVENELFSRVKDYIRENDVNEYQVAMEFEIPIGQVKKWIKEGRIVYKENKDGQKIVSVRCQKCGEAVIFGTLCQKCLKQVNRKLKGYEAGGKSDDSKMRYLDDVIEN